MWPTGTRRSSLARGPWTRGLGGGVAEPLSIGEEGTVPWQSTALDGVDQRIVAALSADGRMSMRSLASQVHVSRANVYTRVERLTREGVIEGFEARVDPARAGLRTSAYIGIHVEQNAWRELAEQPAQIPYVGHVALLSGEFDVLLDR